MEGGRERERDRDRGRKGEKEGRRKRALVEDDIDYSVVVRRVEDRNLFELVRDVLHHWRYNNIHYYTFCVKYKNRQ